MRSHRFKPKAKVRSDELLGTIEKKVGLKLHKDSPGDPLPDGYLSWWWDPETGEVQEIEVVYYRDDRDPREAEI